MSRNQLIERIDFVLVILLILASLIWSVYYKKGALKNEAPEAVEMETPRN